MSQSFTPIKLGEILQQRSFTATGAPNPMSKDAEKDKTLHLTASGDLEVSDPHLYDPRSLWAVFDALTAIKWALIFADYGCEETSNTWCEYFIVLSRQRPNALQVIKSCWEAAYWRVCMLMRTGKTFTEASKVVLDDAQRFQNFLASQPNSNNAGRDFGQRDTSYTNGSPRRQDRTRSRSTTSLVPRQGPAGSKGKGKGQHQQPTYQQNQGGKASDKGRGKGNKTLVNAAAICRNYNQGRCNSSQCSRPHACAKCFKMGHPATECRSQ